MSVTEGNRLLGQLVSGIGEELQEPSRKTQGKRIWVYRSEEKLDVL